MTNNITVKVAGKEIITTQAKLDAVRFDCTFAGTKYSANWKNSLNLDKWNNVRCAHCGQHPHETNSREIVAQLQ